MILSLKSLSRQVRNILHNVILREVYPAIIAPSALPNTLVITEDSATSLTVRWEALDCILHNGNLTGYSVLVTHNVEQHFQRNSSDTELTIFGLMPSTTYTIQVAAVNNVGIGHYSSPLHAETDGQFYTTIVMIRYTYLLNCFTGVLSIKGSLFYTSLNISLHLSIIIDITNYNISYQNINNQECFNDSSIISDFDVNQTLYYINDVQENTEYFICVTALLGNGETQDDSFRVIIPAAG